MALRKHVHGQVGEGPGREEAEGYFQRLGGNPREGRSHKPWLQDAAPPEGGGGHRGWMLQTGWSAMMSTEKRTDHVCPQVCVHTCTCIQTLCVLVCAQSRKIFWMAA